MVTRQLWLRCIESAWNRRSVIWLVGVRRVGKTVLCRSLADTVYLDCELPTDRRRLGDPQLFLDEFRGKRIVLDEIHRLSNPSEILKIAADYYPETRVIATGSSTLGASTRFRDTLTGRKEELWLTPMTVADLDDFGSADLMRRLLRGGLPGFFLQGTTPDREFQEWLDAYWAKDVLEMFRLERRHSFQRLFELLMAQSGGIFEATALARPCEASRTTVMNYLAVLEATHVMHVVRPFVRGGAAEIVSAPRVYAFDTGFVCYFRGWHDPRLDDLGVLWEHLVLNELHAHLGRPPIHYWRAKHGPEVDFVIDRRGGPPIAIECKWSADDFEAGGLRAFRRAYPGGRNLVVARDVREPFMRTFNNVAVTFVGLSGLGEALRTDE